MNRPWITGPEALTQRLSDPAQLPPDDPASGLPPYLESFLAHLKADLQSRADPRKRLPNGLKFSILAKPTF